VRDTVTFTLFHEDGSTQEYTPFQFEELGTWTRVIHAWFGGNVAAPQDMFIEYEKVTLWAMDEDTGRWWPKEIYDKKNQT